MYPRTAEKDWSGPDARGGGGIDSYVIVIIFSWGCFVLSDHETSKEAILLMHHHTILITIIFITKTKYMTF